MSGKLTSREAFEQDGIILPERGPGRKVSALEKALELTYGDRNEDYGDPRPNMIATASMFTGILQGIGLIGEDKKLAPEHVPLFMIALKVARQAYKHKDDNLIDIPGWTNVLERTIQE